MAGLATGSLPSVRLVQRVGGEALPRPRPVTLGLQPEALEAVRRAMIGVAGDPAGTAHGALGAAQVGYSLAVKTGSADLDPRSDDDRPGRKHTWVAGWLPARDPRAVFVVFVYETYVTSSHGAVYVAQDLLRQPEVVAWLAGLGVERAP